MQKEQCSAAIEEIRRVSASPEKVVQQATTVIEPRRGWRLFSLKEVWEYRELAYFLCWRDIKIRYKQTVLGALWAVLQPFLSMLVFAVFFGRLGGLEKLTGDIPYPIFVYAGLLPWNLFSQSVSRSGESVVGSANLVTKVYFPRLVIPVAAVGACLADFVFAMTVLIAMMSWYGVPPSMGLFLTPVFVVFALAAALGIGALLAALTVMYRDFRYVVPFMVQIWMFVTPVIYPTTIVPRRWRWLLSLNPMSGIISGCRASMLNTAFEWTNIAFSLCITLALLIFGIAYFRRVERQFADII